MKVNELDIDIRESDYSYQKAMELKLEYIGFGFFKNPEGKVVACSLKNGTMLRMIEAEQNNTKKLHEANYEKEVRDLIVSKLGSKLSLGQMKGDNRLADLGGKDPEEIAKKVSQLLGISVKAVPPGTKVQLKNDKQGKISGQYYGLHMTKDGKIINLKLSSGGGGGSTGVPRDAAFYEMGLCVEYNKMMGMSREEAMKAAEVSNTYETYEEHLTEVCSKVIKKAKSMGSFLRQTGGDSYKPHTTWPGSDGTPKTDIFGGKNNKISVKKKGGSQLASAKGGESIGMFKGALTYYEKYEKGNKKKVVDGVISSIEKDFISMNFDQSVTEIKNDVVNDYIEMRYKEIKKEASKKRITDIPGSKSKKNPDKAYKDHARSEMISAGIAPAMGNWMDKFIEGVTINKSSAVMKWFNGYIKNEKFKEMRENITGVIDGLITHKRLEGDINKIFEDERFKAWAVYEAATGNFKFSGNNKLNSSLLPVANKILVFGTDGSLSVKKIDIDWASSYASHVKTTVGFKSSGRSSFSSLRLLSEDVKDIINEEQLLFEKQLVDSQLEILSEFDVKGAINNLKSIGKKLIDKVKGLVKNFYENVVKKVVTKIKEAAKESIEAFVNYLGIEMNGNTKIMVAF